MNYSDDALSRIADKNRPVGLVFIERTIPNLDSVTYPARRHRCDLCKQIFECHLCMISEDHRLHHPGRDEEWSPVVVCEDCIHKHELFVVVTADYGSTRGGRSCYWITKFWDHLTGVVIPDNRSAKRLSTRIRLTHDGRTQTLRQWSTEIGITKIALRERLNLMPAERALTIKARPNKKRSGWMKSKIN